MMPPRLQCLHVARIVKKQEIFFKAAFSTTARTPAADDSTPSAADDLLSSIGDPSSSSSQMRFPFRADPARRASSSPNPTFSPFKSVFSTGAPPPQPGNPNANRRVLKLIERANNTAAMRKSAESSRGGNRNTMMELKQHKLGSDLGRQIWRRWKAGDVYAPHDLSAVEMGKWKKRERPEHDAFDILDVNPIDEYKNFSIMSEFMTPMGRIKPVTETGLRRVNQRKIAKAIRRSIGLGMMPSVHRHPEILYMEATKRRDYASSRSKSA